MWGKDIFWPSHTVTQTLKLLYIDVCGKVVFKKSRFITKPWFDTMGRMVRLAIRNNCISKVNYNIIKHDLSKKCELEIR